MGVPTIITTPILSATASILKVRRTYQVCRALHTTNRGGREIKGKSLQRSDIGVDQDGVDAFIIQCFSGLRTRVIDSIILLAQCSNRHFQERGPS